MILSAIAKSNAQKKASALANTQRVAQPPTHPIILCHGLFGFNTIGGIVDYWNDIPEALRGAGADVFVAEVPATSAVETRAARLKEQIVAKYRGRSVHLIGHSMGGLDCRYLVSHLLNDEAFNVVSVTTIATPHRGSPAADIIGGTGVAELAVVRAVMNLLPVGSGDGQAFASLSTANSRTFNACTPDRPGVRYFSWGASFIPGALDALTWGATHLHISLTQGENDGVVSLTSAQWGEYLGTVKGVNHTEIIGHKFVYTRPTDVLNFLGGQPPFDYKQFYVKHLSKLTEVEK
ncbi:hypothetical protein FRC10_008972 [Ceratobasidium sp. 414]|nr:hypothetical protein FRC10_008972 [Ceratobasidium sp. 414]